MKNPLFKRLPYILKDEIAKYLIIFLFMAGSIGLISGFLVADGSMIKAYNDSFDKYNIEDGHFRLNDSLSKENKKTLEKENVTIYNLNYIEEEVGSSSTIRLFKPRNKVNQVCIMDGKLPKNKNEIAIDRMYADNNNYQVGQTIKVGKKKLKITGFVALSDYSALFSKNSDLMFDAIKFGVGIVSDEGFESFKDAKIYYNYAWTYNEKVDNEVNASNDFLNVLVKNVSGIDDYIPQYANQAIHFTGDDMGGDEAMMTVLLYIIIGILAFVFAITTKNTIESEAPMIGTLRAMGYTKKEMLVQYMTLPILVSLVACLVGNILGYTVLKDVCAGMYYGSYSLPTYTTIWNAEAFLLTTVIPIILMILVNFTILYRKLSLSPLKFLRRDLKKRRQKHTLYLSPKLAFFSRFRMRVIFQNISNYVLLFVGILFANLLLMFGLLFPAVLDHYQEVLSDNLLCNYQYILQIPLEAMNEENKLSNLLSMMYFQSAVETDNEDAEKFSAYSLNTYDTGYKEEEILLYGLTDDSRYISIDFADTADSDDLYNGVYISSAYADKYSLKKGDTIKLKEIYEDDTYQFTVDGIYNYEGGLTIFMPQKQLNDTFDLGSDYFSGYLSKTEITDIDQKYISSVIDLDSLSKISRQLTVSMGSMMSLVDGFAILMFVILIYLLSKIIIDKNAQAISMTKILGYTNWEISRLYILSTSIVVVLFLLISLPIESIIMTGLFRAIMITSITGWIPLYMDPVIYVKMFVLGFGTYLIVALLEYRKIKKVPMDEALKNIE